MGDPAGPRSAAEGLYEEGRRAFPGVALFREAFARALARFDPAGGAPGALPAAPAPDLFLAAACDEGVAGSWEALLAVHRSALAALLRSRGGSESEAAEVLDDLPGFLCEPPPDGRARTRLGTFRGRSRLSTWLGAIALRRLQEKRVRRAGPLPETPAGGLEARSTPPLQKAVGTEAAARFEGALHEAWGTLTPKECLAVLLKYRDGLDQRRIAGLLGVGEPRVSRLVQAGVAKLREAVRKRLRATASGPFPDDERLWNALREAASRGMASSRDLPH